MRPALTCSADVNTGCPVTTQQRAAIKFSQTRQVHLLLYSPPLCWSCTFDHLGCSSHDEAFVFTAWRAAQLQENDTYGSIQSAKFVMLLRYSPTPLPLHHRSLFHLKWSVNLFRFFVLKSTRCRRNGTTSIQCPATIKEHARLAASVPLDSFDLRSAPSSVLTPSSNARSP